MARKRSQHLLTMAIVGPLTLGGLLYVIYLYKIGDIHGFKFSFWLYLVGWNAIWCVMWFIYWKKGEFKRYEEADEADGP